MRRNPFFNSSSLAWYLLILASVFCATASYATNKPDPVAYGGNAYSEGAKADASAGSVSTSNSGSVSTASTGPSNANANNAISFEDRLQTPSGVSTPVFASHSCALGGSLGLAGPGFGVTGGKAKSDPKCDLRETVRILATLNPALALALLCQQDPDVAKAAGPDGCKLPPPAPVVQIVQPAAECPVNAEREKKILERCVSK